jgi:ABC-2 type transport system permease protein
MHRVLIVARRDYLQTVLSKAFLFGLVLMPLLFGGGFLAIMVANKSGGTKEQRIAIVDRTGVSAATLIQACEQASREGNANSGGMSAAQKFVFEQVAPEADEPAQLLELSDRVRRGGLFMFVDISANALRPPPGATHVIRYYTNATGINLQGIWLPAAINDGLRRVRLEQLGVEPAKVDESLRIIPVERMDLVTRDPATGAVAKSEKSNAAQAELVPFFLAFLLVLVVMAGAAPNLGAVAEDKVQRVFEMLLVSASSFELMMGKVIASLGIALTSSAFYIIGGMFALAGLAMFGAAPLDLLPWFFAFLIVEVAMLSALAVALGSACSSTQDAQQLAFLLFLPVFIPMFTLTPVMQQPNGVFATTMSFIPPFTPIVMLLRQGLPGGVPWWEPWLGLAGAIAYALFIVWAASRIFRIGILSQGKTPKLAELAQWVVRG